uniref:Putative salivary secreted protein n=1 Tax=Panstrongylus lignarius TaxID=156445 RepID=A0A224XP82_9HEMI
MARGIFVTLLLVSCLYVTYAWGPNVKHNLIVVRKGPNDVILFQKTVSKSNWKPWGKVSVDVTYPVKKAPGYRPVITEIDAMDLDGYDKGGYATITKGGVGRNNVTLHFKSQRGHGFKFALTVFGHN